MKSKMKNLKLLKIAYKVSLFAFLLCSFGSHVQAKTLSLEEVKLELKKINHENLGIIIWDQREQVTDKSQPDSFLGYFRTITGIAWPYFPKSGESFSELMLDKIQIGYTNVGVVVNTISTLPFDSEEQILEKIKNYNHDKVLVIKLNKFQFDGVLKFEYVIDVDIRLFDTSGKLLFNSITVEDIPQGKATKFKKTVPVALSSIFGNLLNDDELIGKIEE